MVSRSARPAAWPLCGLAAAFLVTAYLGACAGPPGGGSDASIPDTQFPVSDGELSEVSCLQAGGACASLIDAGCPSGGGPLGTYECVVGQACCPVEGFCAGQPCMLGNTCSLGSAGTSCTPGDGGVVCGVIACGNGCNCVGNSNCDCP
jgi:hypothetical protein